MFAGLIGLEVSLLFAHQSAHNYFVAMLQPLRIFHMMYIVLFLLTGASLAEVLSSAIRCGGPRHCWCLER